MAEKKISALTAVTTAALTDLFAIVQGGVTYKATLAQLISDVLVPARGEMYLTATALTALTATTPAKAAGTTQLSTGITNVDFDHPASNRLRYTGAVTKSAHIACSFSVTSSGNGKLYEFTVAKNGTPIPGSEVQRKIGTGADVGTGAIHTAVDLAQNDYLELWVENLTDGTDATIETLNLFAMMMPIP